MVQFTTAVAFNNIRRTFQRRVGTSAISALLSLQFPFLESHLRRLRLVYFYFFHVFRASLVSVGALFAPRRRQWHHLLLCGLYCFTNIYRFRQILGRCPK